MIDKKKEKLVTVLQIMVVITYMLMVLKTAAGDYVKIDKKQQKKDAKRKDKLDRLEAKKELKLNKQNARKEVKLNSQNTRKELKINKQKTKSELNRNKQKSKKNTPVCFG